MNENYIAGFFDGEGSAIIVTIKRTKPDCKGKMPYRFRPIIKISQNTISILNDIQNYLGYGHVNKKIKTTSSYTINGLDSVIKFVDRIAPYCILKRENLLLVKELAVFQNKKGNKYKSCPYTLDETIYMIDVRDRLYKLNDKTRRNMSLLRKYTKEQIIADSVFYTDIQWKEESLKRNRKIFAISKELQDKSCELIKNGYTFKEAGSMLNLSPNTVQKWCHLNNIYPKRHPHHIPDSEIIMIRSLLKDGLSQNKISKIVNRPQSTISRVRRRYAN